MTGCGGDAPRVVPAGEMHEALYAELCVLLEKYGGGMSAEEILALASNLVGKLIAMQDRAAMSPERAREIVILNLEEGNRQAVRRMRAPGGGVQ